MLNKMEQRRPVRKSPFTQTSSQLITLNHIAHSESSFYFVTHFFLIQNTTMRRQSCSELNKVETYDCILLEHDISRFQSFLSPEPFSTLIQLNKKKKNQTQCVDLSRTNGDVKHCITDFVFCQILIMSTSHFEII